MSRHCDGIMEGECRGWGFHHWWHGCQKQPGHMIRKDLEHVCRCGETWMGKRRIRKESPKKVVDLVEAL